MGVDDGGGRAADYLPANWRAQLWCADVTLNGAMFTLVETALAGHGVRFDAARVGEIVLSDDGEVWDCAVVVGAAALGGVTRAVSPRVPLVALLCPEEMRGRGWLRSLAALSRWSARINLVMVPDDAAARRVVATPIPVPLLVHHGRARTIGEWAVRAHAYGDRSRRRPLDPLTL